MKRLSILSLLTAMLFTSLQLTSTASADHRFKPYVDYDLICQHADDLKYISKDLQAVFTDNFVYSRIYGKLINRTVRIRSAANRIHRHALAKSACDWRHEIKKLDGLVCDLNRLVEEAVYHSRYGYDKPICSSAVRTANKLIRKADYHVRGLEDSLLRVEQVKYARPNYKQPAAPVWTPPVNPYGNCRQGRCDTPGFVPGSGNRYNGGKLGPVTPYSSGSPGIHGPRGFAGIGLDQHGLAFNMGGLKFYLNR